MIVTKESEGRLNAFAKEPEIEVLSTQASDSNGSRIFLSFGILLFIGLIAFTFTIR